MDSTSRFAHHYETARRKLSAAGLQLCHVAGGTGSDVIDVDTGKVIATGFRHPRQAVEWLVASVIVRSIDAKTGDADVFAISEPEHVAAIIADGERAAADYAVWLREQEAMEG